MINGKSGIIIRYCFFDIEICQGEAECLPLADGSVDYTFSHALTKHLPVPIQYAVLAEFARIARLGVICSFGVFSHLTYEFWRRRQLKESYPVFLEELNCDEKRYQEIAEQTILKINQEKIKKELVG